VGWFNGWPAFLYERKFDYVAAGWTTVVPAVGFVMMKRSRGAENGDIVIIAVGCGMATAANGLRMVREGRRMVVGV